MIFMELLRYSDNELSNKIL